MSHIKKPPPPVFASTKARITRMRREADRVAAGVAPPARAPEAAAPMSWYRWVGLEGDVLGMTTYGASGPSQDVLKHFGFTVENVVEHALKLLAR